MRPGRRLAVVAGHERRPVFQPLGPVDADIGVVIARHDRHLVGGAQRVEPGAGEMEFLRQRDVSQVAGNGDVVVAFLGDVARHRLQRAGDMDVAAAQMPGQQAQDAL